VKRYAILRSKAKIGTTTKRRAYQHGCVILAGVGWNRDFSRRGRMAAPLVADESWKIIEPLLPPGKTQSNGRPTPSAGSGLPHRHRLRPEGRHPVGDAAPGDERRIGYDLLAMNQ